MDLSRKDSKSLAKLIDLDPRDEKLWGAGELADVLAHQLRAPLRVDLVGGEGVTAEKWRQCSGEISSFGALFHHQAPPVELLNQVKQFAKHFLTQTEKGAIPPEVATVLYYAAILTAATRARVRISDLSSPSLKSGIAWILRQTWLDAATRSIFEEGLHGLDPWDQLPKRIEPKG